MNSEDKQNSPHEEPTGAREPYEKPAVISEEVFETLALACGKSSGACAITGGGIRS
jgi:hypothetical protein